ncbi:MAG TPA: carboxypeptidase regulatory-like domain-containing protein [Gemmatimonadaceae bacterium]|nr:carboxypeptidase regulatory-like domain-containing protein [Gemmatimonadaceae bacterium]
MIRSCWLVLLLLLLPALAAAQGTTEVVRGVVRAADGTPVGGALITVTSLPSRATRTTRSNDKGAYTVLFASGEGEYLVSARSLGFAPATTRIRRVPDSNVLIADLTLQFTPVRLDSVTVFGRAPFDSTIGGLEHSATGGALFSLNPADLNALAASVPGVLFIPGVNGAPGSYSMLGAPSEQNNVLVDGMRYSGAALPAEAISSATLAATTFDPSRGQFSGGQMALTTRGGSNAFTATLHGAVADRHLAWADPASPIPLPEDLSWSGSIGGPITQGKAYYFGAFSEDRTTSDLQSLLAPNQTLLAQYGLARDTVRALASALGVLGVPISTDAIPDDRVNDQRSAFLRLDLLPSATTSITLSATGSQNRQLGAGISALTFPSLGSSSESDNYELRFSASTFTRGFLDELKTGLQGSSSTAGPYLSLPYGDVRVGARFEDGQNGLTLLGFGGGTSGETRSSTNSWETTNQLSWLTHDGRERVNFGQSLTVVTSQSSNAPNQLGTFAYQSLADLAANHPASYSRTLSSHSHSSHGVSGALWLGGDWRSPSDALRMQYGVRLDIARAGTKPLYNPAVNFLFDRRTDDVPHDIGLSPRLGFTWTPGSGAGAAPQLGAQFPLTISGGIGAFRGVIPPSRVAAAADATGLPNTVHQLACVGAATPVPDWTRFREDQGTVPLRCLDGTAPVAFSIDQPRVALFSPDFAAPVSWRANVQVNGVQAHGWSLDLSGLYSLGLSGESSIDLNLQRTPAFTLSAEADRPVFVPPEGIVASSGAVAPGASRLTPRYSTVSEYVSDLRSETAQLSLSLRPPHPLFGKLPYELTYTFTHNRAQQRGFDGSTAGDPFLREWAEGQMPTHQFMLTASATVSWVSLALRATLSSGVPYTPMVVGDVNGDGQEDDRAFVFDPARTADPVVASEMAQLLASAPPRVHDCLASQLGRVAGRNSCHTGWRLEPDMNLTLTPPGEDVGFGHRLNFTVTTVNGMGALLRVLGLSNTALGRLTSPNYLLDPALLYVDGFDPASKRFRYRVNQQFGEARARRLRNNRFSGPFQVQVGAEIAFGGPSHQSLAQQLGLVASSKKEPAVSPEQVRRRLRSLTSNPLSPLLELRDSLALTPQQVKHLQAQSVAFDASADSIFAPLAQYVAQHGPKIEDKELEKRMAALLPAIHDLMLTTIQHAAAELTDAQEQRLPPYLRSVLKDAPHR